MANLTITIDDDLLKRARVRAIQQGTSVNAILRDYLTAFAGDHDRRASAVDKLIAMSRTARTGRGKASWTRDELHER